MNTRGTTMLLALMLGVIFFLLGLALAPGITEVVSESMTELGCSTATDEFVLGGCVLMDLSAPWIIGIIFAMGGAALGASIK